ncbi:hypothetical protein PTKIN_Ptkin02bG0111600 [Pterospermum kingtungense]
MLAVPTLRNTTKDENKGEMQTFTISSEEFPDFTDGNLLESIDFDHLFVGMDESDVLPDLEMDPEILAELPATRDDEESEMNVSVDKTDDDGNQRKEEEDVISDSGLDSSSTKDVEVISQNEEHTAINRTPSKDADREENLIQHKKRITIKGSEK